MAVLASPNKYTEAQAGFGNYTAWHFAASSTRPTIAGPIIQIDVGRSRHETVGYEKWHMRWGYGAFFRVGRQVMGGANLSLTLDPFRTFTQNNSWWQRASFLSPALTVGAGVSNDDTIKGINAGVLITVTLNLVSWTVSNNDGPPCCSGRLPDSEYTLFVGANQYASYKGDEKANFIAGMMLVY